MKERLIAIIKCIKILDYPSITIYGWAAKMLRYCLNESNETKLSKKLTRLENRLIRVWETKRR